VNAFFVRQQSSILGANSGAEFKAVRIGRGGVETGIESLRGARSYGSDTEMGFAQAYFRATDLTPLGGESKRQ